MKFYGCYIYADETDFYLNLYFSFDSSKMCSQKYVGEKCDIKMKLQFCGGVD